MIVTNHGSNSSNPARTCRGCGAYHSCTTSPRPPLHDLDDAYVFSLLDDREDEEAKHMLMRLYRHGPESYLPELQEMIDNVQAASAEWGQ